MVFCRLCDLTSSSSEFLCFLYFFFVFIFVNLGIEKYVLNGWIGYVWNGGQITNLMFLYRLMIIFKSGSSLKNPKPIKPHQTKPFQSVQFGAVW